MAGLGFVFAGQGAQYPGMGSDLYREHHQVRKIFDEAEKKTPGITHICFEGSKDELTRTSNTQPCLFLLETAIAGLLGDFGIRADATAGFSAGETAAIQYSGVMEPGQAYDYAVFRAAVLDKEASGNEGKMAAILKFSSEEVTKICERAGDVWAVNFNCPGQTVISGIKEDVEVVIKSVTDKGGRARVLDVSGAFHSPLMKKAGLAAFEYLRGQKLLRPEIPLYSNVTGETMASGEIAYLMSEQISSPVLWEKTIRNMIEDGISVFVEIGPGEVLSGLIRRIDPGVETISTGDITGIESAVSRLADLGVKNVER